MEKITSTLRLRMSHKDAHYGGSLVDGAHMVHLFGDVATELLIKADGDEGLFLRYDEVEFPETAAHKFSFVVLDPSASTNSNFSLQFDYIKFIPIE